MFDFEKFPVYQESEKLYSNLIPLFRSSSIQKNMRDQLQRAITSIILNIAEGAGKYSSKDKKNFYIIARGSVNESVALLRILKLENLISVQDYSTNYHALLKIGKMLSGLVKSMIK